MRNQLRAAQMDHVDHGKMRVQVTSALGMIPVEDATITISYTGEPQSALEQVSTDGNGQSEELSLAAPPLEYSMEPEQSQPYAEYTVEVEAGLAYHLEGDISRIREKSLICHQSSFIRTDWMKEAGYDTGYRIAADYDFFLKTFMEGKTFYKLDQYISVFMKDGVSSTNELERVRETEAVRVKWELTDPCSKEYEKKLRAAAFKQMILDHTPRGFSDFLRKLRRKMRGMDRKAELTGENTFFE